VALWAKFADALDAYASAPEAHSADLVRFLSV